jgi:hypothetical protein
MILEKTIGWIEGLAKCVLYAARMIAGFAVYFVSKRTPQYAHYGMVGLFCLTRGRSNDLLSRLIGAVNRPYKFVRAAGTLGDMTSRDLREPIVSELRDRGYYVFEKCVSEDVCQRLLKFATSHPSKVRLMDGGLRLVAEQAVYSRGAPLAVRYDFDTQALLDNEDVQKLLADLSLAALAQDYLGAGPTIDVVTMWWHTDFSQLADSEAGQYFHFDMDRPKWLKFFIYLTDVESMSGPHTFIAGSHRTRGIPSHLLRKGYARLSDEEVKRVYDSRDFIEFAAPRGTIIAEDTRGLHKGKHVEQGDRLVLQIQFSNSLFGAIYPKAKLGRALHDDLRDRVAQWPGLYAGYLSNGRATSE